MSETPTTSPLLVGVDVGSTMIKAGVVDAEGRELVHASVPTGWQRQPAGVEIAPGDFVAAVRQTLEEVLAAAPAGDIAAVGVTSMAETVVLLDRDGEAIGPSIAWYDRRAVDDFAEMTAEFSRPEISRRTGLGPDQIPTVPTLRWLLRHHPELGVVRQVVGVAEWVVYALGGRIGTEASLASRTGALAITTQEWWGDVLRWAGVAPTIFPDLHPAGADWGRVGVAGEGLGRLSGSTLTVAGHDHLVASIGSGVTDATQVMDSCGTAEAVIRAVAADPATDPSVGLSRGIATGWHVIPDHYALLAGLPLGLDLTPLLARLGASARHGRTDLDDAAIALLEGFTTSDAASTEAMDWYDALRAAVARSLGALHHLEELGGPVAEVRIGGGWAANPVLRRLKDPKLPNPLYPLVAEAGIRGAALIGGLAAGVFSSIDAFPRPAVAGPDRIHSAVSSKRVVSASVPSIAPPSEPPQGDPPT